MRRSASRARARRKGLSSGRASRPPGAAGAAANWVSPPGNLYLSLCCGRHCRAATAAQLGFVAALGVGDAIGELAPRCRHALQMAERSCSPNGKKVSRHPAGNPRWCAGDRRATWSCSASASISPRRRATTPNIPATSLADEGAPGIAPEPTCSIAFVRAFRCLAGDAGARTASRRSARPGSRARMALGEPIQVRLERETLDGRFLDLDERRRAAARTGRRAADASPRAKSFRRALSVSRHAARDQLQQHQHGVRGLARAIRCARRGASSTKPAAPPTNMWSG